MVKKFKRISTVWGWYRLHCASVWGKTQLEDNVSSLNVLKFVRQRLHFDRHAEGDLEGVGQQADQ